MRNTRRLLALGAVCVGALGVGTPASALTISVGGAAPTIPLPVPLPASASASLGGSAPLQVDVQAPGATGVSVQADPTGVHVKATAAGTPLADTTLGTPKPAPASGSGAAPAGAGPVPADPSTAAAPSPSPSPSPSAVAATGPLADTHESPAPRTGPGTAAPLVERDISAVRRAAHGTPVTASIASSPRAGFLTALPGVGARLLLWIALAGAVLVLRLFVGSATAKRPRAT